MKLKVVPNTDPATQPWYADGLQFTCSQCGNCCTGGPGFVWMSRDEIVRLAEFLKITPEETVERYCRKVDGKFSLNEVRDPATGSYDCIFLKEMPAPPAKDGQITQSRRGCSIYPVRPLQCRTWPFWPENLSSRKMWDHQARKCHGMNAPGRSFTLGQIHAIRDANDWPKNPPTSATAKSK
jgi:Fe-S-cluster containining protein